MLGNVKKTTLAIFGTVGFLFFISSAAWGLDFDPRKYLESGNLNYTIEINFTGIDRYSLLQITEEITARRAAIDENPGSPAVFVEYVDFLAENGFSHRAEAPAENAMPTFLAIHAQEESVQTAEWLLTVANAAGSEERLNQAYNAVLDILAAHEASPEVVVEVMKNRETVGQSQTALAIGEDYLSLYPDDAELLFRTFLLTTRRSIYEVVPRQIRNTAQNVLAGRTPNSSDMERYFSTYFSGLWDSLRLDLLERAVELEPENYQYNLTNAGFRAIVRWLSLVQSIAVTDPSGEIDIEEIFRKADTQSILTAKSSLETALLRRPDPDIQVFLAAAMHYATTGLYGQSIEYAREARETRPDRPEGYDALIFLELIGSLGTEALSEAMRNRITTILLDKLEEVGENPYDYFVLSGLETRGYIDSMDSASDSELRDLRNRIRYYAEKSLELSRSPYGLISLGNAELLGGNIDRAEELYSEAIELGVEGAKSLGFTNRAVAALLEEEENLALRLIRRALENDPNNSTAAELLNRLGK
jgi:tetratricopeptide (TPR) repeat protein